MSAPRLLGTARYAGAWLLPWQPVFRTRAAPSGLTFFVHRRDVNGRHIAKYGGRERALTAWIQTRLAASPPGLFVDVGANMGWHAIHAAQHPSVHTVVAFEPDAFNAWLLDRNLAANGVDRVVSVQAAVGAENGTARLYRYKPSNLGRHSLAVDHGMGWRIVPLLRADDALAQLGLAQAPVRMMKIDVEGAEPDVLAGAPATLARADALVLEYSPELCDAGKLAAMREQLRRAQFSPFVLDRDGGIAARTWEDIAALAQQTDLVALRSGAAGAPPG